MSALIFLLSVLVSILILLTYTKGYRYALVPPLFYLVTVLYTLVIYSIFPEFSEVPFSLHNSVSPEYVMSAIRIYLLFSVSYLISLLLTKNCFRVVTFESVKHLFPSFLFGTSSLLLISLVSPVLFVLWLGPENVWMRYGYLKETTIIAVFARLSLPISAFAAALINNKYIRIICLLLIILPVFAQTSRAMLLVGLFYFIGVFVRESKVSIFQSIIFVLYSLFTVAFTLEYRSHEIQGIYGHFVNLFNHGIPLELVVYGLNFTFLFSVFLLAYMLEFIKYDIQIFWLAINPLPSVFLEIDYLVENAKINKFAPYSAIGELASIGEWYLYTFAFLLAQFFSFLERLSMRKSFVLGLAVAALISLYTLMSTQYNLRGVTRLIYYLAIFSGIWYFAQRLRLQRSRYAE